MTAWLRSPCGLCASQGPFPRASSSDPSVNSYQAHFKQQQRAENLREAERGAVFEQRQLVQRETDRLKSRHRTVVSSEMCFASRKAEGPLSTAVLRVFYKYLSSEDSMTKRFHDQIHLGDAAHYIPLHHKTTQ